MIEDLIKYVQEEINEAREFFDNDEHFNEVFQQAGWTEEEMRIFDCGYVKGLENILSKVHDMVEIDIQENGEYGETE